MPSASQPARQRIAAAVFAAWFIVVSVIGACLVGAHMAPLPQAEVPGVGSSARWQVTHVLGDDCGCSSYVAEALLKRGPKVDWDERVIVVAGTPDYVAQLRGAGFQVEVLTVGELQKRTGIEGVPWLAVYDPEGTPRYSGGYAAGRPGINASELMDLTIMAKVSQGDQIKPYPSFGCAVSRELRAKLDPLSLK